MNNVVDRVPTQVLQNGAVRWEQFDSNGNSLGYVYLKRADEPTEEGTKINKVLFDSIKTDLDSKLPTDSKATQSEAQTGTNNTKYMTPLRTDEYYTARKATQTEAQTGTDNTKYMTPLRTQEHYENRKASQSEASTGANDTKYMTPLRVKEVIENNCKITNYNVSLSNTNTINLSNYTTANTVLIEIEAYVVYSTGNRFRLDFSNGNNVYVTTITSTQVTASTEEANIDIGSGSYGHIYATIYPKNRQIFSSTYNQTGGTGASRNYKSQFIFYSAESMPSLSIQTLSGSSSYLKLKVFDTK